MKRISLFIVFVLAFIVVDSFPGEISLIFIMCQLHYKNFKVSDVQQRNKREIKEVILVPSVTETTRDIPVPKELLEGIEATTIDESEDASGEYDYPTIIDNDAEFRKKCKMDSKYFLSYC